MQTMSAKQHRVLTSIKSAIASRRHDGRGPGRIPWRLRRSIVELISDGIDVTSVAKEIGLSEKVIERWMSARSQSIAPKPRVLSVIPDQIMTPDPEPLRLVVGDLMISIARRREVSR